jgi:hypothetical protein
MASVPAQHKSMTVDPNLFFVHPGANRKKLAQSEPKLVSSLVMLMDSPSLKVQCQAALALRNLASDGMFSALISYDPIFNTHTSK